MGLDHYLFAAYVFILVCAALIIAKRMFADVKRQKNLLDEQERKLLRDYGHLEDHIDELNDFVAEALGELAQKRDEIEALMSSRPAVLHEITEIPASRSYAPNEDVPLSLPPQRHPAKLPVPDQLAFEQVFNEITEKTGAPLSKIHEKILLLSGQGKTRAEIAKKFSITQTEVELVIGMNKSSRMTRLG
jgi:uncharacterized coiled-coil protein SlyX